MNLDEALQTFIVESRELLEAMEDALLSLGQGDDDAEPVGAIFRAAHTIKGSAGLFGLDHIVAFTHVAESVLDEVRSGGIGVDGALVALLLACADHIGALINRLDAGQTEPDPQLQQQGEPLRQRLQAYLADRSGGVAATVPQPATVPLDGLPVDAGLDARPLADGCWHISLRFGTGVLRNGMDPLSFLRYLRSLGTVCHMVTLADALPPAEELDPECCYLGFEIAFRGDVDQATLEGVFEFVLDDCLLTVLPPGSDAQAFAALIASRPEPPERLRQVLQRCGVVLPTEGAPAGLDTAVEPTRTTGPSLPEGSTVPHVKAAANAGSERPPGREARAVERQSVRVDADKLDQLIDMVGELIIAAAGANLAARRTTDAALHEAHSTLAGLVEQVRDSALQLRMVKIGATFSRFQRVVHDVSRELGKDIALVVSGEDAELDKTVVEKITDPLTHLVRNAMDHGIESAERRAAAGKPARGTVRLNAYHDSGSIVIEVGDDGGGLNRERILAKALERGLIEPGRQLSDSEAYALIFEPGFSTAEQVTNLSGRGVGMDVVKRNITALRGSVAIASQAGQGTTVSVRLPLTLAIINGFQVGVGRSVFVVPMDVVEECTAFSCSPGHDYTNLRGEVLPFMRLRALFDVDAPPVMRENIVVVRHGGQAFGLVVDSLLGEFQTVIKPLSKMFAHVKGISGSSIRGSGEVALILDVPALLQHIQSQTLTPANPSVTLAA